MSFKHSGIAEQLACPLCSTGANLQSQPGAGRIHAAGCGLDTDHQGGCGPAPPPEIRNPRTDRIAFLERKREATKADLLLKFEDGDMHGVQDCASDLRDIESELRGLRL